MVLFEAFAGKLYFSVSVVCWTLLFHMLGFNVTCRKKHLIVASMVLFKAFAGKLYFIIFCGVGLYYFFHMLDFIISHVAF